MRRILAATIAAVSLVGFSSLGFAAEPNPTVKDFLAACSTVRHIPHQKDSDDYVQCEIQIVMAAMSPDYCAPPANIQHDDIFVATVEWLKQHPDLLTMDETPGILIALKALYCR